MLMLLRSDISSIGSQIWKSIPEDYSNDSGARTREGRKYRSNVQKKYFLRVQIVNKPPAVFPRSPKGLMRFLANSLKRSA